MQISQIMSRPVFTCRPDDSLEVAAALMWEAGIGCVVVMDDDAIVGIITDRDVCMGAYTTGQPLWAIPVSNSMAANPIVVEEQQSLWVAEKLMREARIRRLPVTDAFGQLVGILSLDDIALEAQRERGLLSADVRADEVASTLAAISASQRPSMLVAIR